MSKKIEAIVYEDANKVGIGRFELAECGPDHLICETLYTFVSPGTELRVLAGHYGASKRYPLIPGYSAVARVLEVGKDVKGFREGDLVSGRNPLPIPGINAMWGGQAAVHLYREKGEDRPVLLPESADPLDYVIAEVSAISLRGVEAANPVPGETAIVLGQGLIGAFSAMWLMDRGCRVVVGDMDGGRLARALKRGAAAAVNMAEPHAVERLGTICNGGADIVVEASGSIPGVKAAYQLVRRKPQNYTTEYKVEPIAFYHQDWPRLIMQANYIDTLEINPFSFSPGEGITILSPADRGVEDRQKAVEALRQGRVRSADYIEKVMSYKEAADGYAALQKKDVLSVAYKWQ